MKNNALVRDHYERATHRLAAVELLFSRKAWADTVRESQEAVELLLKGLLRAARIEVPRVHEPSSLLIEHRDRIPAAVRHRVEYYAEASRQLRRDRELAFYGSEDLTPSEFYKEADAEKALQYLKTIHSELEFLGN